MSCAQRAETHYHHRPSGRRNMKNKITQALAISVVLWMAASAFAQTGYTTVRGKCTDEQGKPFVGATVHMEDKETGRKYDFKTDKNGEDRSIGVSSGVFRVGLLVDGKEVWFINNRRVALADPETVIDFDLRKEKAAVAKDTANNPPKMTDAQKAELEKMNKENANVKNLNG